MAFISLTVDIGGGIYSRAASMEYMHGDQHSCTAHWYRSVIYHNYIELSR